MKIKSTTLIPPFNFGRRVSEEEWFKTFPKAPKQNYESEQEYQARIVMTDDVQGNEN